MTFPCYDIFACKSSLGYLAMPGPDVWPLIDHAIPFGGRTVTLLMSKQRLTSWCRSRLGSPSSIHHRSLDQFDPLTLVPIWSSFLILQAASLRVKRIASMRFLYVSGLLEGRSIFEGTLIRAFEALFAFALPAFSCQSPLSFFVLEFGLPFDPPLRFFDRTSSGL